MIPPPHNPPPAFERCFARPDDGTAPPLLADHLAATAAACGRPDGTAAERVGFLAGLCHDLFKAQRGWQQYIRAPRSKRPPPPPHGPPSAALFAGTAASLLQNRDLWGKNLDSKQRRKLVADIIDWARVIADHHGRLRDIDAESGPPWTADGAWRRTLETALHATDLNGFFRFASRFFPELETFRKRTPGQWFAELDRRFGAAAWPQTWNRNYVRGLGLLRLHAQPTLADQIADRLPRRASRLVAADRMHAAAIDSVELPVHHAADGLRRLAEYCSLAANAARDRGASPDIVGRRGKCQETAAEAARSAVEQGQRFFSLVLPTGFGKTITALRIGLELCRNGRCSRIVYAAPYISILSQAAGELAKASGHPDVLEHHHLSLIENAAETETDPEHLWNACESWQAPIVATTFNQFFTALFPRTAQQTFRRRALQRAFVIIDESQIIAPKYWNLFLRRLRTVADAENMHVLFTTATQPLLETGLQLRPPSLVQAPPAAGRYAIQVHSEPMDAETVAAAALERRRRGQAVAVVLNTVLDAVNVFEAVKNRAETAGDNAPTFFLCGPMLPAHKASIIAQIKSALRDGPGPAPLVVCTQVLEAGVDLSFHCILRARSILPSIVQTAGRANRHGEYSRAQVIVFDLVREDGADSRKAVYRNHVACELTDDLLRPGAELPEEKTAGALEDYFRRYARQSPDMQALQAIERAAMGEISALAGIEPFGPAIPTVRVFVPRTYPADHAIQILFDRFGLRGPDDIPDRLRDRRTLRKLSFLERKLFASLVNHFTVGLRPNIAQQCASPLFPESDRDTDLYRIDEPTKYDENLGLAVHYPKARESGMEVDGCMMM